jgi:hypothetical protein
LFTSDHVEIHVSLWQGNNSTSIQNNDQKDGLDDSSSSDPCTIVEIQRRKGCPIRYHRYCRLLLDAAVGHLPDEYTIDADKLNFSKQVMKITEAEDWQSAQTNTLLALDIAASLLKKDRMDARELGMESLCLLTDSTKTGFRTAVIASRAVLLGSYNEGESVPNIEEERLPNMNTDFGIREAVLSFIQLGRLSEDGEYKDASEESLLDSNSEALIHPEQREHYYLLHNLALNVLANALDVLQQEHESKNETTIDSSPTSTTVQESPVSSSKITNKFLKDSAEISQRELISTLLGVLGQAASKPHNACLSAQCLRHLFQASITARRRARDLNAKQIVSTALDVGRRTHAKLELEAEKVKHELMQFDDEEDEESERELDE